MGRHDNRSDGELKQFTFGRWLQEYYDHIKSGDIIVGYELESWLDLLHHQLEEESCYVDTTRSDLAISFIETTVKLTKSPFFGKPFLLQLWQKAFCEALYSVKMPDGTDRFRRALLLVARKNGKSEFASALLLFEFICGGVGMDICCASNDDKQSDILYTAADTMRELIDPAGRYTRRTVKDLTMVPAHNHIFKLADTTRNKEGRNIDVSVIDEVHEMRDNSIVSPIEQSTSVKDNPKVILITTEGFVNDGFLDEELRKARAIIAQEDTDKASFRYLPWLYTQDNEQEIWRGTEQNRLWMKSNPSLGAIKKFSYLDEMVATASKSKSERGFVLSKDFNIKQSAATAWLERASVERLLGVIDLEEYRGQLALGAVDIAETTDLNSARIGFFSDEGVKTFSHYWICENKMKKSNDKTYGAQYEDWAADGSLTITPGNFVDPRIIADWFYDLYKTYDIQTLYTGYDIRFASSFIAQMNDIGLQNEMVQQSPEILHNAIQLVEADIDTGRVAGFSTMDKWCLGNAALQLNSQGKALIVKIRGQNGRKIDGAVTLAILYEMYFRHKDELA